MTEMAPSRGRRVTEPSRRFVIGLGASGLLIVILGGYVVGRLLGPDSGASLAGMSHSASAMVSPSPSPTASVAMTLAPTPSPTPATAAVATTVPAPAGPPSHLAVGGWAKVSVPELNVRSDPRMAATTNYRLVGGAAAYIAEGPVSADGFDWYRIISLGGARGWAASGSPESAFLTMFEEDASLAHCGRMPSAVLRVEDGSVRPHDPIHMGDLALPASGFDELELGALELVRSIDGEACIGAEIDADGEPRIDADIAGTACGRASRDTDGTYRLQPAAGQDVIVDFQVKVPAIVHPAILTNGSDDDPMSRNLRSVFVLMGSEDGIAACVHARVSERSSDTDTFQMVDGLLCVVVEEHTDERIVVRPGSAERRIELLMTAGSTPPGSVPMGVHTELNVTAVVAESGSAVTLTGQLTEGCG